MQNSRLFMQWVQAMREKSSGVTLRLRKNLNLEVKLSSTFSPELFDDDGWLANLTCWSSGTAMAQSRQQCWREPIFLYVLISLFNTIEWKSLELILVLFSLLIAEASIVTHKTRYYCLQKLDPSFTQMLRFCSFLVYKSSHSLKERWRLWVFTFFILALETREKYRLAFVGRPEINFF